MGNNVRHIAVFLGGGGGGRGEGGALTNFPFTIIRCKTYPIAYVLLCNIRELSRGKKWYYQGLLCWEATIYTGRGLGNVPLLWLNSHVALKEGVSPRGQWQLPKLLPD